MAGEELSREAIAKIEVGQTIISRQLSIVMVVCFLVLIFVVPTGQLVLDLCSQSNGLVFFSTSKADSESTFFADIDRKNDAILRNIHELETSLEEESFLRKFFLPPLQYMLLKVFGQGNEKAIEGREGWLYYSQSVDYLIGQPFLDRQQLNMRKESRSSWDKPIQPDPIAAIVEFKEQLAVRNIELILVPVPVKSAVHPENLSGRLRNKVLTNRSWDQFIQTLNTENVHIFDSRQILASYAREHGAAFLKTDTHWSPGAMQVVAEGLGEYIKEQSLGLSGEVALALQKQVVIGQGDISNMLTLPDVTSFFPVQEVAVQQVITEENEFWQPDPDGDILLLGDSFTNIYSVSGLGWGIGAGFAEHLSYCLKKPLDLLARNDSGAYVTREMLSTELARGRDRLAGKKLVIWEFAERELSFGDWKFIALKLGEQKDNGFFVVPSGEKRLLTGVVNAISKSPKPGAVPYKDNILTVHLVDVFCENGPLESDQLLVYGWGMRENQLTELATLRAGDSVSFSVQPWDEVEGEYGSYRRSPLDDEMLELELPNWGTIINEKSN